MVAVDDVIESDLVVALSSVTSDISPTIRIIVTTIKLQLVI